MNFELMFQPLRKYADFQGRARRAEYWLFALFLAVVFCALFLLNGLIFAGGEESPLMFVIGVGVLGIFVPGVALRVRRLHDTGRSGWWLLLNILPALGPLVLFIFDVWPGVVGPNKFGPDPKQPLGDLAAVF
jgi:uncharacterized membrane protein YhaH (DUF805 family)